LVCELTLYKGQNIAADAVYQDIALTVRLPMGYQDGWFVAGRLGIQGDKGGDRFQSCQGLETG